MTRCFTSPRTAVVTVLVVAVVLLSLAHNTHAIQISADENDHAGGSAAEPPPPTTSMSLNAILSTLASTPSAKDAAAAALDALPEEKPIGAGWPSFDKFLASRRGQQGMLTSEDIEDGVKSLAGEMKAEKRTRGVADPEEVARRLLKPDGSPLNVVHSKRVYTHLSRHNPHTRSWNRDVWKHVMESERRRLAGDSGQDHEMNAMARMMGKMLGHAAKRAGGASDDSDDDEDDDAEHVAGKHMKRRRRRAVHGKRRSPIRSYRKRRGRRGHARAGGVRSATHGKNAQHRRKRSGVHDGRDEEDEGDDDGHSEKESGSNDDEHDPADLADAREKRSPHVASGAAASATRASAAGTVQSGGAAQEVDWGSSPSAIAAPRTVTAKPRAGALPPPPKGPWPAGFEPAKPKPVPPRAPALTPQQVAQAVVEKQPPSSGGSGIGASAAAAAAAAAGSLASLHVSIPQETLDAGYVNPVLACVLSNCSVPYLRCISNSGCSNVFECLQSDSPMEQCVKFHDAMDKDQQAVFAELAACEEKHFCFKNDAPAASGASASSSASGSSSGSSAASSSSSSSSAPVPSGMSSSASASSVTSSSGSGTAASSSGSGTVAASSRSGTVASSSGSGTVALSSGGSAPANASASTTITIHPAGEAARNATRLPPDCDTLCEQQCALSREITGATDPMACIRACSIACFKARFVVAL